MGGPGRKTPIPILLALLAAGCASGPAEDGPAPDRGRRAVVTAGESAEGRSIACHLLGSDGETVLLLAAIHGNESAGTPLLRRLAVELLLRPDLLEARRVLIVPVANPDGLARGTRRNARGVDLNRNFPAVNFRPGGSSGPHPLSEPESRALHGLVVRYGPDRVVSVHQPLALVDWDGPGEDLARAMARAAGLPARRLGGRPGSLGSWVGGALGIPIVTVELPGRASRMAEVELFEAYGPMLLRAVAGSDVPVR